MLLVCACVWSPVSFWSIVTMLAVSHYLVALVYSRRQLAAAFSSPSRAARLVLAAGGGVVLQQWNVPLLFYFGIHHTFSEVYVLQREVHAGRVAETGQLRLWSVLFNLCVYLAVTHDSPGNFPLNVLLAALAVSAAGYFSSLWQLRRHMTAGIAIESCALELSSLGLLALSFYTRIDVTHYIAYHVIFWALYPLPRMIQTHKLGAFAWWHAVILAALWLAAPFGPMQTSPSAWATLFIVTGYLHISISFALSSSQPAWLNRLFGVEGARDAGRHRWVLLHAAGRAVAFAMRLVPRRRRFGVAVAGAHLLHGVIRRTAAYREERSSNVDTIREIALYHVLRVMTEHGTPFDLDWTIDGYDEARRALDDRRGVLFVGPHAMLSTLLLRFVHDHGHDPLAIAGNPDIRISGTTIAAHAVSPTRSYLIGIRGALQRGGVVCAMIDEPETTPNLRRTQEIVTGAGPRRIADALIKVAARCGAHVVFGVTRVRDGRVVMTFRTPSPAAAGDAGAMTEEFIAFVQSQVPPRLDEPRSDVTTDPPAPSPTQPASQDRIQLRV